jgi:alpha-D-ribose 1-methylphosphonate 5-triphosphate synthase subunit PhnH
MTSQGFVSVFTPQLEAYLAFKQAMAATALPGSGICVSSTPTAPAMAGPCSTATPSRDG